MELALLVYFASIVGGLSSIIGLFSLILAIVSAGIIFTLIIGDLGVRIYGESDQKLKEEVKVKNMIIKVLKFSTPLSIILALCSTLLPTERTVYLMTAAYATQTIAQNERVQKIGSDVLEVVEKKLGEMKKD